MTLTLKARLSGAFGALLLIFAVSGLFSILNLREQRDVVHEIVTNDMPMMDVLAETTNLLELYRKTEKDVLLNIGAAARQRDYHARLAKTAADLRARLEDLDKATQANEDLAAETRRQPRIAAEGFARYDSLVQQVAARLADERDSQGGHGLSPQAANELLTRGKDDVHVAERALRELEKGANAMFRSNQETLAALARRTEHIVYGSLLLGLLAGAGLALATLVAIVRPLGRVVALAKAVAAGDLDARAAGTYSAEMAELKASIEGMVATLKAKIADAEQKSGEAAEEGRRARLAAEEANAATARAERARAEGMMEAAGQLEKVAEIIGSASEQLSAQVEQSSRGAEQQAARVAETATAMEEMNSTVLEVAKNASQAAQSTEAARGKALEGSDVVGRVVAGIGDVRRVSLSLKEDMATLGRQAEGIGQVMNVISDIADQTNLLALNAAIEAARAGDAGRGFAVVADEVRKLAEKTMAATREVGEAIRGIQDGTRKNLENVDRAAEAVELATGLAEKSGQSLSEIVRMVEEATDQVRSIATASEQQSATSEEINRSIEEINRISGETADAMRQSAQAVGELAGQTQNLRGLIERMKAGG